jgi:hypothetical protein
LNETHIFTIQLKRDAEVKDNRTRATGETPTMRTRATGGTPTTSTTLYSDSRNASNSTDMGNKSKKSVKHQYRQQQQKQNIAKPSGARPPAIARILPTEAMPQLL